MADPSSSELITPALAEEATRRLKSYLQGWATTAADEDILAMFWTAVLTGGLGNVVRELDENGVMQEVMKPAALRDRLKASELLAKARGMFVERTVVDQQVHQAITVHPSVRDRIARLTAPEAEEPGFLDLED